MDADGIMEMEREMERLRAENQRLKSPKSGGARSWISRILLPLGLLALIPASLMLWLNRTVTTPEGYMKAMGPVIQEPAVQKAVQKASTEAIFQRVDVNTLVQQALPENAQFLAEPIGSQVKSHTNTLVGNIVASPRFEDLWVQVNQRAQARFMDVARNSSGDPVVDVSDLYKFVSARLADTRLSVLANRELPPRVGEIQVANIPALERIPQLVAALDTWRWVLLGLVVVLLGLGIWAARNRRKALLWTGWGAIAATVVSLALVRMARAAYLDPISDPVYRDGAVAMWQTVLNPLLIQVLVLALLGLALVVTGWLLGPGRVATDLREGSQYYLANLRLKMMPAGSGLAHFAHDHRTILRWGLVAVTVLVLMLFAPLTLATAATILLVAVLALIVIEFFAVPETAATRRH
jgi:hypothetical protein